MVWRFVSGLWLARGETCIVFDRKLHQSPTNSNFGAAGLERSFQSFVAPIDRTTGKRAKTTIRLAWGLLMFLNVAAEIPPGMLSLSKPLKERFLQHQTFLLSVNSSFATNNTLFVVLGILRLKFFPPQLRHWLYYDRHHKKAQPSHTERISHRMGPVLPCWLWGRHSPPPSRYSYPQWRCAILCGERPIYTNRDPLRLRRSVQWEAVGSRTDCDSDEKGHRVRGGAPGGRRRQSPFCVLGGDQWKSWCITSQWFMEAGCTGTENECKGRSKVFKSGKHVGSRVFVKLFLEGIHLFLILVFQYFVCVVLKPSLHRSTVGSDICRNGCQWNTWCSAIRSIIRPLPICPSTVSSHCLRRTSMWLQYVQPIFRLYF